MKKVEISTVISHFFHDSGLCRGIPLRAPRSQGWDSVPESTTSLTWLRLQSLRLPRRLRERQGSLMSISKRSGGYPTSFRDRHQRTLSPPPFSSKEEKGGKRQKMKKTGSVIRSEKKAETVSASSDPLRRSGSEDARDWPHPVSVRGAQLRDFL